jgi:hypothetical protein
MKPKIIALVRPMGLGHEYQKNNFKIVAKTSIKFLFALLCALSISCNNGDDNQEPTTLDGIWLLKSVRGGIAGTNDEFNNGEISWTFDNNGNISVSNSNTDDTKVDLIESGDYLYNIAPNPATPESCSEAMFINGVNYGCYAIDDFTLVLNQVENDGYEVTLQKIGPVTNQ